MQGPGFREQQFPQEFGKQKLEPADDAENMPAASASMPSRRNRSPIMS